MDFCLVSQLGDLRQMSSVSGTNQWEVRWRKLQATEHGEGAIATDDGKCGRSQKVGTSTKALGSEIDSWSEKGVKRCLEL